MKRVLGVFAVWVMCAGVAEAYCREPVAPASPAIDKPRTPPCIEDTVFGRTTECSSYTVQTYKSDVKRYEQALQRFINESQRYANDAFEFAKCEMREINETMPR